MLKNSCLAVNFRDDNLLKLKLNRNSNGGGLQANGGPGTQLTN
jgi:hypothetical protein